LLDRFNIFIENAQDAICAAVENADGKAAFQEDLWERPGGGGGRTRVIAEGAVFEKGGVNISHVHGELPEAMKTHFGVKGSRFAACGISLVLHPRNPYVPTVHANYRYFEVEGDAWFGGGADLTPYYLFEDDSRHFHRVHKAACDRIDSGFYPEFKKACDGYFVNTHRGETRGIGGIFYDYKRADAKHPSEDWLRLARFCADGFIDAYIPIVEKRKHTPYFGPQRHWQEIRRGRYAEFNLIHDRGTLFGLKTDGRIESILMSLPPQARWEYMHAPKPGTPEAKLVDVLRQPRSWA
jgi:coproporphyrinogen III oxidase